MANKKKKNPYEDFGLQSAGLSSGDNVKWKTDNPYEEYGQGYTQSERDPSLVWDWNKKEDVAKAVVETKKESKPEERKRSFWEKFGDRFEANSPEDKAKRLAEGKPELFKDQKDAEASDKNRTSNLDFNGGDTAARRDYFKRQGVDLDTAIKRRADYNDVFTPVKDVVGKNIDWKSLAEKAKSEGVFDGKEDAVKDLESATKFEQQGSTKASRTFYRQSLVKALDDISDEKLKKIEQDFSDFTASQGKEALPQQVNRNFQRGLAEAVVKFPGSARTLASGALDVVAPEGSRVDKFAQKQFEAGKENLKGVDQQLIDQGVGANPNDNRFVGTVSAGAGSLASSLFLGGLTAGGEGSQAVNWIDKARQALNPGVAGGVFGTNAGAEQYIGALDAGKSDFQAFATSLVAGAAEGYLEKLGVEKFLGATGNVTKQFITRALSEGLQEASQSFAQSAVKSTYTSVDFSDALMQALEEGGYGALIGGAGSLPITLAENMIAKGVPENVARDTAEKVSKKVEQIANEELPDANGDDIVKQLQGDGTGQPVTDGTGQDLPTDGDAIVQALQGEEQPALPVDGTQQPVAGGQPTDLPTDGDAIVQALQGEDNGAVPTGAQPTDIPTDGDSIVKELQGGGTQQFAVDQPVDFNGKKMIIVNVLKTDGDTKYELVDPNGSATKSIWTNQAGLESSNIKQESTSKPANPPEVEPTDSAKEWETKYAEKYGELDAQVSKLTRDLKTAPKAQQTQIQTQIDSLVAEQVGMEQEFGAKWKDKIDPNNPEQNVQVKKGAVKTLKKNDSIVDGKTQNGWTITAGDRKQFGHSTSLVVDATNEYIKRIDEGDTEGASSVLTRLIELPEFGSNKALSERVKKLKGYAPRKKGAVKPLNKKATSSYTIRVSDGKGGEIAKKVTATPAQSYKGIELITHRPIGPEGTKVWHVTEPTTGLKVGEGKTQASALADAQSKIEKAGVEKTKELIKEKQPSSKTSSKGDFALFNPDSKMNKIVQDESNKAEMIHGTTRTVEDLVKLAQDLNKAGQANAMLRRGGSKSKKALGAFQWGGKLEGKERIMLQDAVINDPAQYVSTLAHELSHASEFQVLGSTKKTYELFGELTAGERKQIGEELTAIVEWLETPDVIASDPAYFNRPTEQLARYVQVRFLDKAMAVELAPLLTERYDQAVERHPELKNLIDALEGELDKGFRNKVPNWYRDLKQTYQKNLGKRAGTEAYNAEIIRRAKVQKWRDDVSKLIKRKFKGVKDSPETLFKAAESIKMTDDDGNLVYGTRDLQRAQNADEAKDLKKAGYTHVNTILDKDGKEIAIFAKQRYTEEEGKALFESLSPEGQKLVRDFTAQREKAKDFFNREVIKDVFKIKSELEGWVHRGLREETGLVDKVKGRMTISGKKAKLREQKAGAKKMRGDSDSYLADFQKQMEKALLELGDEQINNEFIHKQLARISKPIAKGQMPDKGWTEVVVDRKRGVMLPGEGGRERVSIDKEDVMTGERKQYGFMRPEARYQVPTNLAKHYRNIRQIPEEISTALRITKNLSKFWTINVLTDAGTVATNFIGGGIQYSAKILNDFYVELLTAKVTLPQTRRNIASMVEILLPHGWSKAPDYLYGGVRNNQVGQFMTADRTEKVLDKIGDVVLLPFATVESYWKKAIILSEGAKTMPKKELGTQMVEFSRLEEQMIAEMNNQADFYAYDYDNVPAWMEAWGRNPAGSLVKPFMKYPYKYSKMVTDLASGAFDKTLPVPDRMAKLLTLTTLVGAALGLLGWRDEERKTPEGTEKTPASLRPGGRLYLGTSGENELFMRISKYPFVDIASTGKALINKQFQAAGDIVAEKVGSIGPYTSTGLALLGYTNKFETYTPLEARVGKQVASFIPGFRILSNVGRYQDPVSRRPETFVQGVFGSLPAFGNEETRLKYRGDRRTVDIPDEGETRSISEKSTSEKEIKLYRSDILLSALTGIYISRINPEDAIKQMRREQRNDAEQQIRALLTDGKEAEAEAKAKEANMTIPKGTYDYYRRKR